MKQTNGKYLGDHVTDEQLEIIKRFSTTGVPPEELQIGDYWVVDGAIWRIDSYLDPCGYRVVGPITHHAVMCPLSQKDVAPLWINVTDEERLSGVPESPKKEG